MSSTIINALIILVICCIPILGYLALRGERRAGNSRWLDEKFGYVWMTFFVTSSVLCLILLIPRIM